ncbi:MAG: efflux RND transporter permease subunit [Gammaproteobacteria bacterium]
MNFTDIFIRRPVFATALSFMILVLGIASYVKMPVRQFPEIASSVITVTTTYPGASADLMAGFVTTPLENAIGSIDGIDYMTSQNVQNTSTITVNLKLGYPFEEAITDVGNEVSSVRWMLPQNIQDPVIAKVNPSANPTVYIAFQSDTESAEAVTDQLLRIVQPQLQTIQGVSQAEILGEREYAMRINIDPGMMASLNVSPNDVMNALRSQNLQAAAGRIEGDWQEFNITANTDLQTADEFNNLVLHNNSGHLVRLQDVGKSMLGAQSYRNSAVINGSPTTVIGIIPQSTANPLAVSKLVEAAMPSIQKQLPPSITAKVVYDSSIFIQESINEVYKTIIEASILVIIIIMLFLGSLRAVLIPVVTIPLSLIGVCGIMLMLGYTINTLTLLAWVLAIGLVVDDSIVVLENIHRHLEEGLKALPAAIIGAREIGFAVIAMTFTLAAVYAPIGLTGGLTGILFSEFAFTLAGSVIISGFIALTLSPMMCARILKYDPNDNGLAHKIDVLFEKIIHAYKNVLQTILAHYRWHIMTLVALGFPLVIFLLGTTPSELAPNEDQGVVLMYMIGPSSSNIKFTEKYTTMLNPILQQVKVGDNYGIINGIPSGVNSGIGFLSLIPWSERNVTAQELQQALFPKMWAIPGLKIIPLNPQPLPTSGGMMPLQFVIKSPQGIKDLAPAMSDLMRYAAQNPGLQGTDTDLKLDKPQINIDINRDRAGDLDVSIQSIADAMNIMFGEPLNILFSRQGRAYYVIPEYSLNFGYSANPNNINNIYLRANKSNLVPLSSVLNIEETVTPQSINHFQQLPSASLTANTAPGYTLGEAIDYLNNFMAEKYPNLQVDLAGQARSYEQSKTAMLQVGLFAIIFIFLVLAAQFESYRDPLIVLCVVPLTLSGAIISLRLTGGSMNIYSEIGLTTLVGLIAKHGILIVEFANQLQLDMGHSKQKAALESAAMRLRPILMTTAAMVLGAVPLALATGAGASSRNQIGWVIVGGMTIGTLFSLFVVPTLYSVIGEAKTAETMTEEEKAQIRKKEQEAQDKQT